MTMNYLAKTYVKHHKFRRSYKIPEKQPKVGNAKELCLPPPPPFFFPFSVAGQRYLGGQPRPLFLWNEPIPSNIISLFWNDCVGSIGFVCHFLQMKRLIYGPQIFHIEEF